MSEKKNLDRLFQEKFKDFEATPPEFVWDNLEEILQKKKKRRVVPLWWRMGGVAAVLILGMVFLYPYLIGTPDATKDNGVVFDGKHNSKSTNTQGKQGKGTLSPDGRLQPNRNIQSHGPSANEGVATNGKVVDSEDGSSKSDPNSKSHPRAMPEQAKQIATNKKQNGAAYANNAKNGNSNKKAQPANGNPYNSTGQPQQYADNIAGQPEKQNNTGNNPVQNRQEIADGSNPQQKGGQDVNGRHEPVEGQEGQKPGNLNELTPEQQLAENIQPVNETPVDSLKKERDPLFDLMDEEKKNPQAVAQNEKKDEDKDKTNSDAGKWNIKPQMGPLVYSSLSNGSPIDPQFAGNDKSFDNQMSYGLGINYALTDRLKVRSGINNVNLSYATEGVQFYASLDQGTNNVARTGNANIVVQNQQETAIVPTNSFANSDVLPQETFNGSMVQRTGYIEVPVEMEYALLNKQFGIDVIGGFSTLFLSDNQVSVVSNQGLSTDVGRAQNLSSLSFSTNLGLGFRYRFFKQFQASFEPTFKYQLNTYTRDSGNFRPYFIGLYTGISFSF